MSRPAVSNLQCSVITIPDGQSVVVEPDRDRTFLHIQGQSTDRIKLWVGSNPPPGDLNLWLDTDVDGKFVFTHGVQGPVRISSVEIGDTDITIMSSIHEQPTIGTAQQQDTCNG